MSEFGIWVIGQGVILMGALFMGYLRIQVSIARLDERGIALKEDYDTLTKKVDGISRHVAKLTPIH